MSKTIRTLVSILAMLIIVELGLLFIVPDEQLLVHAVSEDRDFKDTGSFIPRSFIRAKFNTIGFADCQHDAGPGEKSNVINMLVSAHSSGSDKDHVRTMISAAINSGCDINELNPLDGLTALHGAVLFADVEMVEFLLESGANPGMDTYRPGKPSDKKNALEFSKLISGNDPDGSRKTITAILEKAIKVRR